MTLYQKNEKKSFTLAYVGGVEQQNQMKWSLWSSKKIPTRKIKNNDESNSQQSIGVNEHDETSGGGSAACDVEKSRMTGRKWEKDRAKQNAPSQHEMWLEKWRKLWEKNEENYKAHWMELEKTKNTHREREGDHWSKESNNWDRASWACNDHRWVEDHVGRH